MDLKKLYKKLWNEEGGEETPSADEPEDMEEPSDESESDGEEGSCD